MTTLRSNRLRVALLIAAVVTLSTTTTVALAATSSTGPTAAAAGPTAASCSPRRRPAVRSPTAGTPPTTAGPPPSRSARTAPRTSGPPTWTSTATASPRRTATPRPTLVPGTDVLQHLDRRVLHLRRHAVLRGAAAQLAVRLPAPGSRPAASPPSSTTTRWPTPCSPTRGPTTSSARAPTPAVALGIDPNPATGGTAGPVTFIVFPGRVPSPVENNTTIDRSVRRGHRLVGGTTPTTDRPAGRHHRPPAGRSPATAASASTSPGPTPPTAPRCSCTLQRHRRAELDPRHRRHPARARQVPGRHRRGHRQRHQGPAVHCNGTNAQKWTAQPAQHWSTPARASASTPPDPARRTAPAADLDLHRGREPAVEPAGLTRRLGGPGAAGAARRGGDSAGARDTLPLPCRMTPKRAWWGDGIL